VACNSWSRQEIEVTRDCCPECGEHFDEPVGVSLRLVEEAPDPQPPEVTQYNRHCTSATLVDVVRELAPDAERSPEDIESATSRNLGFMPSSPF